MTFIEPAEVERIKKIDLLAYLQHCEPDELVRLSTNTYCTKTHDSLKISNGKWYWWSRGFGGISALGYLVKVRDMTFLEAIRLLGGQDMSPPKRSVISIDPIPRALKLPPRIPASEKTIAYLMFRGIDKDIIMHCLEAGLIYHTHLRNKACVAFVGYDGEGVARYAAMRALAGDFKGEAAGSDKRYAFRLCSDNQSKSVHVFESAIDLLSYATIVRDKGADWRQLNMISLGGVSPVGDAWYELKLPRALAKYLEDNPDTRRVVLHLDMDKPGVDACCMIAACLAGEGIEYVNSPPPEGNDINEYLMRIRAKSRQKSATQSRAEKVR